MQNAAWIWFGLVIIAMVTASRGVSFAVEAATKTPTLGIQFPPHLPFKVPISA